MKIETITPIHIGTGEKYKLLDSYIDGNYLYRVNLDSVFSNTQRVKEYVKFVDEKNVTRIKEILKSGEVRYKARLSNIILYRMEDEIREIIKDAHRDIPYIPGSSIKGALRTVLIIAYLKRNNWNFKVYVENTGLEKYNFWDTIKNGINKLNIYPLGFDKDYNNYKGEDLNKRHRAKTTFGKRFENLLVYTGKIKWIKRRYKFKYDAKYDIFKFLEIGDFYPIEYEISIDEVWTLTNQRRRAKEYVETLEGSFSGVVSLSPIIKNAIENPKEYPILEDKLAILGLDSKDLDDITKAEEKMIKHILKAVEDFVNDIASFKNEKVPMGANMRIGYGIGTLYQGFWKYIAENIPIDRANDILRIFSRHRNDINTYPKSKKVLKDGRELGWIRLEKT